MAVTHRYLFQVEHIRKCIEVANNLFKTSFITDQEKTDNAQFISRFNALVIQLQELDKDQPKNEQEARRYYIKFLTWIDTTQREIESYSKAFSEKMQRYLFQLYTQLTWSFRQPLRPFHEVDQKHDVETPIE